MGFISITTTHLFKFLFFIFLLFQHSFSASTIQFISNHTVIFEDDTPRFLTYGSPVSIFPFFEGLSIKNSAKAITLKIWMPHNCTGDVKILLYNPIRNVRLISQYRGGNKANVFNGTTFVPTGYLSPDPPLVSTYVFATDDVVPSFRPEVPLWPVFNSLATANPNGEWEIYFEDSAEGFDGYVNKVVLTIQGKKTALLVLTLRRKKKKKMKITFIRWMLNRRSVWNWNLFFIWSISSDLEVYLSIWLCGYSLFWYQFVKILEKEKEKEKEK